MLRRIMPRSIPAAYSGSAFARLTHEEPKRVGSAEPIQFAEVASQIADVQEQIKGVGAKIEVIKVALDQANLPPEKREILLMEFKSQMAKEKALMDEKKALMDEKKALIEKEKSLIDKDAILGGKQSSQSSGAKQSWFDWLKAMGIGAAILAAIATLNKDTDRWIEAVFKSLTNSLAMSRPIFQGVGKQAGDYISRPALEGQILAVYENATLSGGYYSIVYGVKGAGKSTVVQAVLQGKTGVVAVGVSADDTREKVISKIYLSCGKIRLPSSSSTEIRDALLAATIERVGRPVTIVFEVESASSSDVVMNIVKHIAKELAEAANVLLVLSEANAVLGFGEDPRQKFIFVDEMTREEARQYVEKRAPGISPEDFNKFADKCGTRPMSLEDFCRAALNGQTVGTYIDKELDLARGDLASFIHKPILAALKKTPGGVHHTVFDSVKHEGVLLSSPKLVAPAMKITPAIMYDFGAREYKLFSKAHQTALETYDP